MPEKKRKPKVEFLDESPEPAGDQVEFLDDEFEDDEAEDD